MLSDVVLIILGLYACSTPLWFMKAVKFGMKCVENPADVIEEPVFTLPDTRKTEKPELTEEMKADLAVLANIEAYDGTSNGQKEIA